MNYEVVKTHAGPFADITKVLRIITAWAIVVLCQVTTAGIVNA